MKVGAAHHTISQANDNGISVIARNGTGHSTYDSTAPSFSHETGKRSEASHFPKVRQVRNGGASLPFQALSLP